MPKKIGKRDITGQKGINVIEEVVLEMDFLWYPSGSVEAGIDGYIEIRDGETEEVSNLIIQVQSKATTKPKSLGEDDSKLEYRCDQRDLEYWLQGNAPVILVIVKVETREAYWTSIKDYFQDPEKRRSRKVIFNKVKDRFDASARTALTNLAIPRNSGIYLAPRPKKEKLYSNLLKVSGFGERLYTGYTSTEDQSKAYSKLLKIGQSLGQEWLLVDNLILSFHDLRQHPWSTICDSGTVEEHDVEDWAQSHISEHQRQFVWLLNKALREKVNDELLFDQKKKCYYFKPTHDLTTRKYNYHSLLKKASRDVFLSYDKKTSKEIAYYRHSAFEGQFLKIESDWFLEIKPTYFFTRDGFTRDKYDWDHLSGIKRIEKNAAVFGQLVMWAEYLITPVQGNLFFSPYPFLQFDKLEEFEVDVGIDDSTWVRNEESDVAGLIEDSVNELPLFKLSHED